MSTATIQHVSVDERGRVSISKAVEVLSRALRVPVTGFDISVDEASNLVLKPTTSVPAANVVHLDAKGWEEVTAVLDHPPKPNAAFRKLAQATAGDRARRR